MRVGPACAGEEQETASRRFNEASIEELLANSTQVVRTDESLEMGRRKNAAGEEEYYFDFSRMDAAVESYARHGFQLALQTMNAADWAVLPHYDHHGNNRWRYPHR